MTEIISGHRAKEPEIVAESQRIFVYIRRGGFAFTAVLLIGAAYIYSTF